MALREAYDVPIQSEFLERGIPQSSPGFIPHVRGVSNTASFHRSRSQTGHIWTGKHPFSIKWVKASRQSTSVM